MVKVKLFGLALLILNITVVLGQATSQNESFRAHILPNNCQFITRGSNLHAGPDCTVGTVEIGTESLIHTSNITCPEIGVIRIIGEYGIFQLQCSAPYPMDIKFDGTKPTEAIQISMGRVQHGSEKKDDLWYRLVVKVFSVTGLYSYYHGNYSASSSLSAISDPFRYSRTGSFNITGKASLSSTYTSINIYFEEPTVLPDIIMHSEVKVINNTGYITLPCRKTVYNTTLKLLKNDTEVTDAIYSPQYGFSVNSSYDVNDIYSCQIASPSGYNVTRVVKYCKHHTHEDSLERESGIDITPSTEKQGFGAVVTRITCRINVEDDAKNTSMLLVAIGSENPAMFRLKREFVKPKYMNRSYSLKHSVPVDGLHNYEVINEGIQDQMMSVYCGDKFKRQLTTVDTVLTGVCFPFDFDQEWNGLERSQELKSNWFVTGSDHISQNIYENEDIEFKCKISTFSFIPPCIWYVEYRDGTVQEVSRDNNWDHGVSTFKTKVLANMTSAICAASEWHIPVWWNDTNIINVSECVAPKILNNDDETKVHLKENSTLVLNCSATGEPLPFVYWQRNGSNITAENQGYSKYKNREALLKDGGEYICVATNCEHSKFVSKTFHVDIYSGPLALDSPFVHTRTGILIIAAAVIVCSATCLGSVLLMRFLRKRTGGLSVREIEEFMLGYGHFTPIEENIHIEFLPSSLPYDKKLEVKQRRFQIDRTMKLGEGASGSIVFRGLLDGKPVAVKENGDFAALKPLLSELKVLMHLGNHDNVVRLLGAFTQELASGRGCIFLEYCPLGNLHDFLREGRANYRVNHNQCIEAANDGIQFTLTDLYFWSVQIARGMSYLQSKKIIHGDLAARNILLNEYKTAKISDFGLSNRLYECTDYIRLKDKDLPWRWLALESMKESVFSSQSDVWSYGITLWEIFSLCRTPYSRSSWGLPFIIQIENGMRLARPEESSDELYNNVMSKCWNRDPSLRPSFQDISQQMQVLCERIRVPRGYVLHNFVYNPTQHNTNGMIPLNTLTENNNSRMVVNRIYMNA